MPTNKEALIRYRVINRCLKDFKYATIERLMRTCQEALYIPSISSRTIYQDIRDMKNDPRLGYFAPIEKDRDKDAFYYSDSDYSIDNIPLNEEEVKALTFAATMLDQFRNINIFSTFTGAVQKVVDTINIKRLSEDEDLLPFIQFEQSPASLGQQFIEPLIMAIKDKKVIRFKYQKFETDEVNTHKVHPYLLKQSRHRWYLIGRHDFRKNVLTFCLDRFVSSPEVVDIPYEDIGFNAQEYYKSVIGIISPKEKPQKVVLKFSRVQAWYVITQPIHSSQVVKMKKDHALIELTVVPTYELIMLLMGWGPEVEVIKPKKFREEILKKYQQCLESLDMRKINVP